MSSLSDAVRCKFFDVLRANIRVSPNDKFSYNSLVNLWNQIEESERQKVKEAQKEWVKDEKL